MSDPNDTTVRIALAVHYLGWTVAIEISNHKMLLWWKILHMSNVHRVKVSIYRVSESKCRTVGCARNCITAGAVVEGLA